MILAAEYVPSMYATVWALVPPVVAIVLALITKEVYSSLFVGIVIGGLFYGNAFQPQVLLLDKLKIESMKF
jgi:Na+/H+ antiporter NhaC